MKAANAARRSIRLAEIQFQAGLEGREVDLQIILAREITGRRGRPPAGPCLRHHSWRPLNAPNVSHPIIKTGVKFTIQQSEVVFVTLR